MTQRVVSTGRSCGAVWEGEGGYKACNQVNGRFHPKFTSRHQKFVFC